MFYVSVLYFTALFLNIFVHTGKKIEFFITAILHFTVIYLTDSHLYFKTTIPRVQTVPLTSNKLWIQFVKREVKEINLIFEQNRHKEFVNKNLNLQRLWGTTVTKLR